MGSRGPVPNPHSTKSLRGENTNGTRLKAAPGAKAIKMPNGFPDHAKKFWRSNAPGLIQRGLLTAADVSAFERLCLIWSQLVALDDLLKREGVCVPTGTGSVKPHPAANLRSAADKSFLARATAVSVTPAARLRVPDAVPQDTAPKRMRRDRSGVERPMSDEEYFFGD